MRTASLDQFARAHRSQSPVFVRALLLSLLLHLMLVLPWLGEQLPTRAHPKKEPVAAVKFLKQTLPQRRPLMRPRPPERIARPLVHRPATRTSVVPPVAVSVGPARQGRLEGVASPRLGSAAAGLGLPGLPPGPGGGGGPGLSPLSTSSGRGPSPAIGPGIPGGTGGGGGVEGTRAGANEIDLGLELLDVKAMDTGRHRALVITDPKDKKKLKGYLYLSGVYSASMEQAERDAPEPRPFGETRQVAERRLLAGLSQIMSERTQVRTQVLDAVALDDPGLLQVPFVVLTAHSEFQFTEAEANNLGRYLLSGGFLYVEVAAQSYFSQASKGLWDLPSLRALIRAAFQKVGKSEGKDWSFRRLELSHPLLHCFYDIAALPRGYWDVYARVITPAPPEGPDYVEGIFVGERLAGLYSQKDYGFFWGDGAQRRRENSEWIVYVVGSGEEVVPARFGVNVLVYALTQEGSLAQKLVSVE